MSTVTIPKGLRHNDLEGNEELASAKALSAAVFGI
jgi:hypothetical protein